MQSASKVLIDPATLASWAQKYLAQTLIHSREITEGWFNTIHLLELADGSRAVLKASPSPTFQPMRYERGIMATEVAVYRRLMQAGLKAPRVLVDCPDGDGLGHAWFIMEYLPGQAWGPLKATQARERADEVDAAIAQQAARVNAIEGERFGRWQEDACSSASWATSLIAMVDDLLADAWDQSVILPRPPAEIRALFETSRTQLDQVTQPRLVLWDLHDGNVIVKPDTLELAGLVDPDRALWADPLMEFYFRTVANTSSAWQSAYRQACAQAGIAHPDETPGAARRLALYELYLALVMVIEVAYRGFGLEHETWARGVLDQALTALKSEACS